MGRAVLIGSPHNGLSGSGSDLVGPLEIREPLGEVHSAVCIGKVGHLRENGSPEGSQGLNNDIFLFFWAALGHDTDLLENKIQRVSDTNGIPLSTSRDPLRGLNGKGSNEFAFTKKPL